MVIENYPQSIVKSQFLISPKLAQSLHLPFVLHACVLFVKYGTHKYEWHYCYLPPVPKQKQYHGKIIIPWNWLKSGLKKKQHGRRTFQRSSLWSSNNSGKEGSFELQKTLTCLFRLFACCKDFFIKCLKKKFIL